MAEVVRLAVNAPVEQTKIPALILISPEDQVVRPEVTRRMAAKWGAPHKLIEVQDVEDSSKHVLAGQAMSPSTTEPVAKLAIDWLRQTL